jgi:hypothetical protein
VHFSGGTGTTLNFSQSGVYFVTGSVLSTGEELSFVLELCPPFTPEAIPLECHGRVLRVEPRGEEFGVAATIESLWVGTWPSSVDH